MKSLIRTLAAVALGLLPAVSWGLNAGLPELEETQDRSTPYATVQGFLAEAHSGHYDKAAHYLFLDHIPRKQQAELGPKLARRLRFVLDRKLVIDLAGLSRKPEGEPGNPRFDEVGSIRIGNVNRPLRVSRWEVDDDEMVWVFSPDTVRSIDKLYKEYGPPLADELPDAMYQYSFLELELGQWIGLALLLAVSIGLAWALEKGMLALLARMARLTSFKWDDELIAASRGLLGLILWAGLFAVGTRMLMPSPRAQWFFDIVARSMAIIAFARILLRVVTVGAQAAQHGFERSADASVRVMRVRTQVAVMRRIFAVGIYVIAAALLLIQFSFVRHVGVSMLASAGLAGLVVGFAAQKSIATLLAGIQLTVTQPIHLGDTVWVEGESGTVEEITLTFVVIKAWDGRRLLIPMNYFLEKPFQNWSKGGTSLAAPVTLLVNRQADVDAFRSELLRILQNEGKPMWDGHIPNLTVTETSDRMLLLRAVVGSTSMSSRAELNQLVREKLRALLDQHPEWLPRAVDSGDSGNAPAPAKPSAAPS